jgi:hypothetical protein
MDILNALVGNSPFWLGFYQVIRWIFVVFDIALAVGIGYAFWQVLPYRPQYLLHPPKPKKRTLTLKSAVIRERWVATTKRFSTGTTEAMRMAIIEADSVADEVLKELGLAGEHMADRLEKLSEEEVQSLAGLWRSHRIRNNIVHSPDFEIAPDEAKRAIDGYEAFLKEVGVIEEA